MNKKEDVITVLLAEDESALGKIIKETLELRDFKVILCEDGKEAYELYKKHRPTILVLDVMMPKKDGFTLAAEIRKEDLKTPIIFLTAKSQTRDVIEGFNIGGNDYLKKPFSIEELVVRINNLIHIKKEGKHKKLSIGRYNFNFQKQTLQFRDSEIIKLTHREACLLLYLIENKNIVSDKSEILNKIWGNDDFFTARSMDVYISKLRKKLSNDRDIQIMNVKGIGYKLICQDNI